MLNDIENRKKEIVEKHGREPTICYYYYLWNAINYVGRKNVKESFESVKEFKDEVIVGDYSSDDGTRELAEECGLKVISVEKTPGITFHESKINNKIIHNSNSNFMVDLDIHTVYPKNLTETIRQNIRAKDITKKQLVLRGLYCEGNGRKILQFAHCSSGIIYKPYLLDVRGFDERTYYGCGTTYYILGIIEDIYKLEMDNIYINDMVHRFHMREKVRTWAEKFNITMQNTYDKDNWSKHMANTCLQPLRNNLNEGIKKVVNSYW